MDNIHQDEIKNAYLCLTKKFFLTCSDTDSETSIKVRLVMMGDNSNSKGSRGRRGNKGSRNNTDSRCSIRGRDNRSSTSSRGVVRVVDVEDSLLVLINHR